MGRETVVVFIKARHKKILDKINQLEGWITLQELEGLFYLPQWIQEIPGSIVEIGSFKGKSSVALAAGCKFFKQRRRVYCIDPFQPHHDGEEYPDYHLFNQSYFDEFWGNISRFKVEKYIRPIKFYSHQALNECPEMIAVLFIDGDHRYEGVKNDIRNYVQRVAKRGFLAFHDYHNEGTPGVKQAVDELLFTDSFRRIVDYDSMSVIQKTEGVETFN